MKRCQEKVLWKQTDCSQNERATEPRSEVRCREWELILEGKGVEFGRLTGPTSGVCKVCNIEQSANSGRAKLRSRSHPRSRTTSSNSSEI
jgi:hypothetical protein